tara:strand:- start:700 stop:1317 length:618 start_codon:yes stop_codon:yes gene_type:complete
MGLINKLKKRILFKIIFFIILLLIVFNKVLIHGFQKFIIQNEIKNPLELINTYIKKKNNENFNNLDFNNYQENIPSSISEIYKNDKYSVGKHPNIEVTGAQEVFKNNKFLPECCMYYSHYSSDKGCACITPEQQNYLQRRGTNRTHELFIHEKDLKNMFFSPTNTFKGNKDEIFLNFNIDIEKEPEPLSDVSKNYVFSILNLQER